MMHSQSLPKVSPKTPKDSSQSVCLSRRETHFGSDTLGTLGNGTEKRRVSLPITDAVADRPRTLPKPTPEAIRAELERTDLVTLADAVKARFGARLVHLETDRLRLGTPADALRRGEREGIDVKAIDWRPREGKR